jgi:AcrR family transcriptional regulator
MARWKNASHLNEFQLKRDTVLRESGRIFNREGFHNTSLDDVANHLDVSKATLYNYVKDKQEMLFEFHKMALIIGDEAMEMARKVEANGAGKLRVAIREYIAMVTERLGGYGVIAELGALKPLDRQEIIAGRERFDKRFVSLLAIGVKDGSLRPIDPKMAVFAFMGALQTIPNWFSPNGRLSGAEVAERMTDLLMNGMARTPASVASAQRSNPLSKLKA